MSLQRIAELRNATINGSLNGSELAEVSASYLAVEQGGISEWFDREPAALIGICVCSGILLLICIGVVCYVFKKKKGKTPEKHWKKDKVIQISKPKGFHRPPKRPRKDDGGITATPRLDKNYNTVT